MKLLAIVPALLTASLLCACASAPLSTVDGQPFTRTDPTLYPLQITAVDGHANFDGKPFQLTPGPHTLTMITKTGKTAHGPVEKTYAFKIEPCISYHFAGRRESPMQSDWDLVVESKDPVVGCNMDEEYKKAGDKASAPAAAAAPVAASAK